MLKHHGVFRGFGTHEVLVEGVGDFGVLNTVRKHLFAECFPTAIIVIFKVAETESPRL